MMMMVVVVVFRRKIIKAFDICKKGQTVWHTVLIHTPKTIIPKNADCQIIWQYATCRNVYNKFILQQPFNKSARNDFPHSFSLQLQVNWGIFVLFDPLRRVGLMYINVFGILSITLFINKEPKGMVEPFSLIFQTLLAFRSQCVAMSLYSCSFPGRLIHLQTTLTWPFYLYFLFRFVIDMEIVKGLRSLPP